MTRAAALLTPFVSVLLMTACAAGGLDVRTAGDAAPHGVEPSFLGSFSAPLWVVLVINVATLVSAGINAWAVFRVTPRTALSVAEKQAEVAREAVAASASSADAAREAAAASTANASTAARVAGSQGVHSVARLRQEWINELRSRVAQAHSLLANRQPAGAEDEAVGADVKYRREVNEVVARIELLLNMEEEPSIDLIAAIRSLEAANGLDERRSAARNVILCGQDVLKEEWDRVREELTGRLPKPRTARRGTRSIALAPTISSGSPEPDEGVPTRTSDRG